MTAKAQKPSSTAGTRQELAALLKLIADRRTEYLEMLGQHKKLQAFEKALTDAQAKLDAVKQRDAGELSKHLTNPTGRRVAIDHKKQDDAEARLARAKREAEVARACEPAVIARLAEKSDQIAILEGQIPLLATTVIFEDARALLAEINSDAKRLRAKYAKLWGLRRHVGETPAIRKRLESLPMPTHPDHIAPDLGETIVAAEKWRGYTASVAADPDAEFKE